MAKHHDHPRHMRRLNAVRYLAVSGALALISYSAGSLLDRYSQHVLPYAIEMSPDALLQATNDERNDNGAGSLMIDPKLSAAAQEKANDMSQRDYWSHDTPDGSPPWVFIQQSGYIYAKAGENLAYGFKTSRSTVNGWMNSQTHRDNLLDPMFTDVGFGIADVKEYQKLGNQTVVVAMYGTPLPDSVAAQLQAVNRAQDDNKPTGSAFRSGATLQSNAGGLTEPVSERARPVNRLQSLLGARIRLSTTIATVLFAIIVTIYLTKHAWALRRILVNGEQFVVHHPVLDVGILIVVVMAFFATRTIGMIK